MPRPDDELRPTSIEPFPGAAAGSVMICQGRTRVLCTASVSPEVPGWLIDRKTGLARHGWVTAEYAMLPGSTPQRKRRGLDSRGTEIQRLIGRALRAAVDLDRMPGVAVTCDCDVVEADGGTRTASITGAFVALGHALARARADGLIEDDPMRGHVAAVSVGVVDGRPRLDLDYELDVAAEVDMNVAMNDRGEFIEVQATGEKGTIRRDQLDTLLDLATGGIRQLFDVQQRALGRFGVNPMIAKCDPLPAYAHRGGDTPLMGRTVDDFLSRIVTEHADNEAIVSVQQSRRVTYRQMREQVDVLARGLMARGVQRGDRVGIWSTDNVEWILLQLATARVGAILVNVNPAYRVNELEHGLRLARVQWLFLIPSFRKSDYVAMIAELCPELDEPIDGRLESPRLPELREVVLYDPDDTANTPRLRPGFTLWQEIIAAAATVTPEDVAARAACVDPDDPINIQFTSGTTGFPKAVVLTHHSILNNAWSVGEAMKFTPADRLCVPVPFYHCFGMVVSTLTCLLRGAAIVIPTPHFEAGATLAAIASEKCTAVHGVPTMFIAELEHPDFAECDLSSLRTGIMAGAPCPPQIMRRVMEDMGCREILIAYGLTETSPVTHVTRPDDSVEKRTETVGFNLPHQEVKVVDPETGAMVTRGQTGEICMRGYHIMRGYFEQPDETRKTIDEAGWLHSGDLGVMDDDGAIRITGRLKDMVIRGGENIYPVEIENVFYDHPQIAEVAVFGVPDERMGEEVAAWIMLHEGESAEVDDLREWARARMAHFKVPRLIWIVDEFPATVTGKIQKFRMREIATEWLKEEAAAAK